MIIRDLSIHDIDVCEKITRDNWDKNIATKARMEMNAMFSEEYGRPHFFVAQDGPMILGYAGMRPSWIMSGVYEFIWINIEKMAQKHGIGAKLTDRRLKEVEWRGGSMVMLMTKSPDFFLKFGFAGIDSEDDWVLMKKKIAPLILGGS